MTTRLEMIDTLADYELHHLNMTELRNYARERIIQRLDRTPPSVIQYQYSMLTGERNDENS